MEKGNGMVLLGSSKYPFIQGSSLTPPVKMSKILSGVLVLFQLVKVLFYGGWDKWRLPGKAKSREAIPGWKAVPGK